MNESPPASISRRGAPVAIVIALTLLSGVVYGHLDGRWDRPADLESLSPSFKGLPDQVGDWVLAEQLQLEEDAAKLLRCYGSEVRTYRNATTGEVVNMALLFGPRGPIAVHTPEVCYSSLGTKQAGETRAQSISTSAGHHDLWNAQFSKDPSPEPVLDVWYAWSDGGPWHASEYPRFWLTNNLYKIQVAGPIGNSSHRPCKDFLEAFLPYVDQVIP